MIDFLIKFSAFLAIVAGLGFGAYGLARHGEFLVQILKDLGAAIIPVLAKRGTPEQEAKAQEDYRRGGDGNIPLPAQREKHGNLIDLLRGKRDAKGEKKEGQVPDKGLER